MDVSLCFCASLTSCEHMGACKCQALVGRACFRQGMAWECAMCLQDALQDAQPFPPPACLLLYIHTLIHFGRAPRMGGFVCVGALPAALHLSSHSFLKGTTHVWICVCRSGARSGATRVCQSVCGSCGTSTWMWTRLRRQRVARGARPHRSATRKNGTGSASWR